MTQDATSKPSAEADAGSEEPSLATLFAPAGRHDEVLPLLSRLGLKKYAKTFDKHGIVSISLLRSMTKMGSLRANLKELKMEEADIQTLCAAVLAADTFDQSTAATGGAREGSEVAAARHALLTGELSDGSELSEDEPSAPPEPIDPHRVKLSKEEYDHIMQWSSDEDMETPQGRFRHRQKTTKGYDTSHDTQFHMSETDEGAVVDVSKGPRNILKKLERAATGFQNPVEGFDVEIACAHASPTHASPTHACIAHPCLALARGVRIGRLDNVTRGRGAAGGEHWEICLADRSCVHRIALGDLPWEIPNLALGDLPR